MFSHGPPGPPTSPGPLSLILPVTYGLHQGTLEFGPASLVPSGPFFGTLAGIAASLGTSYFKGSVITSCAPALLPPLVCVPA